MSGNNYLLDTNIILYLLGGDKILAEIIGNKTPYISFITEMELLANPQIKPSEDKIIRDFLSACIIIEMNVDIKRGAISIRKKSGLKLPDSIIAATAEYENLSLLTADGDFNKLKSLNILQYKK
ncbi:MAG: type II toxin-antitoxin system VapC family toxin [Sphingobacteriales bacterium]|nr:type II toxin-antitoxin system VapC family toxin [Sphingobacteriales bacterium]